MDGKLIPKKAATQPTNLSVMYKVNNDMVRSYDIQYLITSLVSGLRLIIIFL